MASIHCSPLSGAARRSAASFLLPKSVCRAQPIAPRPRAQPRRPVSSSSRRQYKQPADNPDFHSILDNPPELVRSGRRHGPGLIILGTTGNNINSLVFIFLFKQIPFYSITLTPSPRTTHKKKKNSHHTAHSLRPRHVASLPPAMEDGPAGQVRGPPRAATAPAPASRRPGRRRRL